VLRGSSLRFRAKVAGAMLMLFGASFAALFGYYAYAGSQPSTWQQQPGGAVALTVPGNATVTITYANGTAQQLQVAHNATLALAKASARITIVADGATFTRDVIVPQDALLALDVAADSPASARVGLDPANYRALWLFALIPALAAVGGYFAFKLRGPRVAIGGAFVFLLGTLYQALGGLSLLSFSMLGTAVLCFVFIYRARSEFRPLRAPPPTPPPA
jgi:hypothetical protein